MELFSWKPVDFIVGGMLTAGVAFGVYKLGATNHKKMPDSLHGMSPASRQIQAECIALAGRSSSELDVSILPQSSPRTRNLAMKLAASRRAAVQNPLEDAGLPTSTSRDSDPDPHREVFPRQGSSQRRQSEESKELSSRFDKPDHVSPKRRIIQTESSPVSEEKQQPELAKQLFQYRKLLDEWTADSEAKLEKLEQQRMELSTELHVAKEALQAERRLRAEAEQQRHRSELQLREMDEMVKRFTACQEEMSRREKEVTSLQLQVRDMEEQLEGLYINNVVTPRHAVQDNALQQQQLLERLRETEEEIRQHQQEVQDLENDVTNLSAQLNKARKDAHQLAEDNAVLEKQLRDAQHAAKDMLVLLYERARGGEEQGTQEVKALLDMPDSELPLDTMLQCLTSLLCHS